MVPPIAVATKITNWILEHNSKNIQPVNIEKFHKKCNAARVHTCSVVKNRLKKKFKNPEKIKEYTLNQKVQLLFMLGLPVNEEFEKILRNAGTLKLKNPGQLILFYRSNDGTFKCETTPEKQIGIHQNLAEEQENDGDEDAVEMEDRNELEDIVMMDDGNFYDVHVEEVQDQIIDQQHLEINQDNNSENGEQVQVGERNAVPLIHHSSAQTTNFHEQHLSVSMFLRNIEASLRVMFIPKSGYIFEDIKLAQQKYANSSTLVPVAQVCSQLPRCVELLRNGESEFSAENTFNLNFVLALIHQLINFIGSEDSVLAMEAAKGLIPELQDKDKHISAGTVIHVFDILFSAAVPL